MKEYKNYIFLGLLFGLCFVGAIHGSHDQDKELLTFCVDSAKQVLAAILTVTTVAVAAGRRATDSVNGGTNVPKTDSSTSHGGSGSGA